MTMMMITGMMMMMTMSTMNTQCISVRDVPIWLRPVQELCTVPIEPGHGDDADDYDGGGDDCHDTYFECLGL